MPPIPPMPPLGMAGASLFGCSVIVASVVTIKPAIDAASWRAVRTTLSLASVVRFFRPRWSVSSTGQSSHILIRCSTRRSPGVILAVNVGGAVIPTLLSIYLLTKNRLWKRGLIAIACVAAICHGLAQPVHGVGIALPIFVPPLVAAVIAAVVSWRNAAPLAYAGGSLGVLIGADLLNLGKLEGLGAPVVSIGGAGTFDGIFVTGLMAVLLAGLTGRRTAR